MHVGDDVALVVWASRSLMFIKYFFHYLLCLEIILFLFLSYILIISSPVEHFRAYSRLLHKCEEIIHHSLYMYMYMYLHTNFVRGMYDII